MEPSASVLEAFGGDVDRVERLAGGEGRSWRAGQVVLKPDQDAAVVAWTADFVDRVEPADGFRLATPVTARDGKWIVDGWAATEWVQGAHLSGAWDRVLQVSAKFHAAAAKTAIGPTKLLTSRRDPWAVGDRVAWRDEERHGDWPAVVTDVLDRLGPLLELSPPTAPAQVIHGDLGGNVLFADEDGLPPAVIDIAPYYRPAAWADAIVVADAVAWNGAPATLAVGFLARHADGDQLLARAIAFRVAAAAGLWSRFPARVEAEVHAYRALLPLLRGT